MLILHGTDLNTRMLLTRSADHFRSMVLPAKLLFVSLLGAQPLACGPARALICFVPQLVLPFVPCVVSGMASTKRMDRGNALALTHIVLAMSSFC